MSKTYEVKIVCTKAANVGTAMVRLKKAGAYKITAEMSYDRCIMVRAEFDSKNKAQMIQVLKYFGIRDATEHSSKWVLFPKES